LRFLLPRTLRHRVPLVVADPAREPRRTGEGRQTPAGSVLRVLAPLDGLGYLCSRRVRESLRTPAVCRGARCFAALFHAARVPGTSLQSFPFPRSRTRSRGPPASLRISLSDHRRRRAAGSSRRFRRSAKLFALTDPPGGGPRTMEPGPQFLATLRSAAKTRP